MEVLAVKTRFLKVITRLLEANGNGKVCVDDKDARRCGCDGGGSAMALAQSARTVHYDRKMRELKTAFGVFPPVMRVRAGDIIETTTVDADGKEAEKGGIQSRWSEPAHGAFLCRGSRTRGHVGGQVSEHQSECERGVWQRGSGVWSFKQQQLYAGAGWTHSEALLDIFHRYGTQHGTVSGARFPLHGQNTAASVSWLRGRGARGGEARSSIVPAEFGGNMDAPEASAGNTLYLPVNVPGALLSFGDGHAAMGDGEVDGTAIEISMKVRLQVNVIKNKKIEWPRFENSDYIMAVGIYRPLDDALRIAFTQLIGWIHTSYGLSEMDAYELLSKVAEIHLDEMVDPNYVVVAKINKRFLPGGKER